MEKSEKKWSTKKIIIAIDVLFLIIFLLMPLICNNIIHSTDNKENEKYINTIIQGLKLSEEDKNKINYKELCEDINNLVKEKEMIYAKEESVENINTISYSSKSKDNGTYYYGDGYSFYRVPDVMDATVYNIYINGKSEPIGNISFSEYQSGISSHSYFEITVYIILWILFIIIATINIIFGVMVLIKHINNKKEKID